MQLVKRIKVVEGSEKFEKGSDSNKVVYSIRNGKLFEMNFKYRNTNLVKIDDKLLAIENLFDFYASVGEFNPTSNCLLHKKYSLFRNPGYSRPLIVHNDWSEPKDLWEKIKTYLHQQACLHPEWEDTQLEKDLEILSRD